ncbi:ABC transporter ATP-binding protein [Tundrisphaera lichenicola]|uniref:ABC transporter ATP-binding protein n=1 Tax=Tundrisphaera lichenicola TaxID=2029860 RepID=UPI003EC045F7
MTAVLELREVTKEYRAGPLGLGRRRAVDRANLRVEAGEAVGLAGPNRAGKTTLLKLAMSLCRPSSGRVDRMGKPGQDRSTLAEIGYVHEGMAFPPYLTASALLNQYGALAGVPSGVRRRRASELLERVGLGDRRAEPIGRFSKGMLQRLALAQSMINRPTLLVLDEPNEGLDLPGRDLVVDLVDEHRRRGGAVLLVSHLLADLDRLCNRVVVVVSGRVVHDGPIEGLGEGPGGIEMALRALYRRTEESS